MPSPAAGAPLDAAAPGVARARSSLSGGGGGVSGRVRVEITVLRKGGEQRIELGREFVLGVQGGPDLLALHRALALRGGELRLEALHLRAAGVQLRREVLRALLVRHLSVHRRHQLLLQRLALLRLLVEFVLHARVQSLRRVALRFDRPWSIRSERDQLVALGGDPRAFLVEFGGALLHLREVRPRDGSGRSAGADGADAGAGAGAGAEGAEDAGAEDEGAGTTGGGCGALGSAGGAGGGSDGAASGPPGATAYLRSSW